jgi:phosphoheptose isomerase
MSFPDQVYPTAGQYVSGYRDEIVRAWQTLDLGAFDRAAALLGEAIRAGRVIYSCGNGGSAAISGHLLCDFLKGIQTDTGLRPKVISLASHLELITAIANDIAYAEVFAYQLRTLAEPDDVLLTISSSGNSENIVRAIDWARSHEVRTIAMTGFSGGRSAGLADVNLHVEAQNYGVVEDIHQSLMHSLAQFLRQHAMEPSAVVTRHF